jgi:hypothetical protein
VQKPRKGKATVGFFPGGNRPIFPGGKRPFFPRETTRFPGGKRPFFPGWKKIVGFFPGGKRPFFPGWKKQIVVFVFPPGGNGPNFQGKIWPRRMSAAKRDLVFSRGKKAQFSRGENPPWVSSREKLTKIPGKTDQNPGEN